MALSVITQSDLFEGIAQPDLERIVRLFTERKYLKGATIFGRGDSGEALYIVKEGLVKLGWRRWRWNSRGSATPGRTIALRKCS
ncbi:MAG: hypothetical protein H6Q83_371 [Deltaproteobacteria bacterium]|nr:hypothetical protein [Deltaproteobacteria bacterium]